jgi:hypothetical protein
LGKTKKPPDAAKKPRSRKKAAPPKAEAALPSLKKTSRVQNDAAAARRYEAHKEESRDRIVAASAKGRDIAAGFPANSIDEARRDRAWNDLAFFLRTYFPQAFYLEWSPDHLRVIAKLQAAIVEGGTFALAMPRGNGKTTLVERAAIWGILTGRRRFICLIGSTQEAAEKLLAHVKGELQGNPLLAADFPSACYPIVRLENNAKRCVGQTFLGNPTNVIWTSNRLVFPTIDRPDSSASGSVITACGLTGNIRGQQHLLPTGEVIRPDFLMLDDPQTRESAASASQAARRMEVIMGDVLGLAGVGHTISAVSTVTVMYKNDLAEQLLDRSKCPQWQGERTKLLYSMPTADKLWDEYRNLRDEAYRNDRQPTEATEFYRAHQVAMDEGAKPAWTDRFNPDEISAVQHAMNLYFRDAASFHAEYQNEPDYSSGDEQELPKATTLCQRVNNHARCLLPAGCQYLTAFIDVQHSLLYFSVVAFSRDFTGYVVSYGTFPDQQRSYFTLNQANKTLQTTTPGASLEAQVFGGLDALVNRLCESPWMEDGQTPRHIDRIFIDASDGAVRNVVYKFCRESKHARTVAPYHGQYIGATKKPYAEYTKHRGDIYGEHWRIPAVQKRGEVKHVLADVNWWKSFVLFQLLTLPRASAGAMTFYGSSPADHRMFCDQLVSETCIRVSTSERTVDEWHILPNHPDNHFLDCLLGSCVAASICGANILFRDKPSPKPQPGEPNKNYQKTPRVTVKRW